MPTQFHNLDLCHIQVLPISFQRGGLKPAGGVGITGFCSTPEGLNTCSLAGLSVDLRVQAGWLESLGLVLGGGSGDMVMIRYSWRSP